MMKTSVKGFDSDHGKISLGPTSCLESTVAAGGCTAAVASITKSRLLRYESKLDEDLNFKPVSCIGYFTNTGERHFFTPYQYTDPIRRLRYTLKFMREWLIGRP
jgi:hypothetical protein